MKEKLDALSAITADLDRQQRVKRRHFAPALLIVVVVAALLLGVLGVRPNLLEQPSWQLVVQGGLWIFCLLLFPAIGVGVWFPPRWVRIVVVLAGVGFALLAAMGWPPTQGGTGGSPCAIVLLGAGAAFLGIGALSGAFAQRRSRSSAFWVAGGIGLAALAAINWICPNGLTPHVLVMHVGPTVGLMLVAIIIGALLHRRATGC